MPFLTRERTESFPTRHELKFFISYGDYLHLSHTVAALLSPDPFGDENNEYQIRSLYFDDFQNRAFYEKIAGVENREKIRLRMYNFGDIKLERKRKFGDVIIKESVEITPELCEQIIACDCDGLQFAEHPLLRHLFPLMRTRLLRPTVLVDYIREAYTHPAQNVRITFDKQLRTGLFSREFFSRWQPTINPLDEKSIILEVKYDHYLPDYLRGMLTSVSAQRLAISKYTICRRYDPNT